MDVIDANERVRLIGRLGLMESLDQHGFEEEVVATGDEGVYVGPHPSLDGWHVVGVNVGGRDLLCPCHRSQFERVTS